eukprot:11751563-Ditylum_brightwellii.AAC.1
MKGTPEAVPSQEILVVVKEHTNGFKESNFNIIKAILELFLALCECYAALKKPPGIFMVRAGVTLAVEKVADKKLSAVCTTLLTAFCTVRAPKIIANFAIKVIGGIKSPIPHEALLNWCTEVMKDFGASSLGNGVKSIVSWILK